MSVVSETTDSDSECVRAIKHRAQSLERYIIDNVANGRRRAAALTFLETAVMYAMKAADIGDK